MLDSSGVLTRLSNASRKGAQKKQSVGPFLTPPKGPSEGNCEEDPYSSPSLVQRRNTIPPSRSWQVLLDQCHAMGRIVHDTRNRIRGRARLMLMRDAEMRREGSGVPSHQDAISLLLFVSWIKGA